LVADICSKQLAIAAQPSFYTGLFDSKSRSYLSLHIDIDIGRQNYSQKRMKVKYTEDWKVRAKVAESRLTSERVNPSRWKGFGTEESVFFGGEGQLTRKREI
jgi:hypothetical protein